MARNNNQVAEFAAKIAREAWKPMNDAYRDYTDQCEAEGIDDDRMFDECEVNLYVYADGDWTIDGAQYLQDHRNIVAVVPLMLINGPMELAEEISNEYDDSECEESDEDESEDEE